MRSHLVGTNEPSEHSATPKTFAFDWNRGREQRVTVREIQPGLWRISLLQLEDERPLGVDAWVLICSPKNYDEVAGSFDQVIAVTGKWGEKVSRDEVRGFLRTALDVLAQRPEK